jgi:hypothetical protein
MDSNVVFGIYRLWKIVESVVLETIVIDTKQRIRGEFEVQSFKSLWICLIGKWRGEMNYNGMGKK